MSTFDASYREISCQKANTYKDFGLGVQDYAFSVGGSTVMHPSKCYFKVSMKMTTSHGNLPVQPKESDQICLADNVCANLFDNISFKAGGSDVSSLVSYCPQASQIRQRCTRSGAWLDTIGKDVFGMDADFKSRVAKVSQGNALEDMTRRINLGKAGNEFDYTIAITAGGDITGVNTDFDGSLAFVAAGSIQTEPQVSKLRVGDLLRVGVNETVRILTVSSDKVATCTLPVDNIAATAAVYALRTMDMGAGKNTQTVLWKPPIGFFDVDKLGAGDYRISLNPNSRFKQQAVQCTYNMAVDASDAPKINTYNFEITDLKLYVALSKDTVQMSGVEQLFLQEQHVQSKPITGTDNTMDFTVPSSTKMIAFFVQSGKVGSNITIPPTSFKSVNDYDLSVESFQLTYANRTRPSTRWASTFDSTANTMQQRYYDTFSECGLSELQGGCESMSEWLKRGPMYVYRFDRDATDKATQVQLSIKMREFERGSNVILCAFYSKSAEIAYSNGMVQEVRSLNV